MRLSKATYAYCLFASVAIMKDGRALQGLGFLKLVDLLKREIGE